MYNVKILKYPSGWQVRVYNQPVGFCDNDRDKAGYELPLISAYDEDAGEFVTQVYNPKTQCIEPFTGGLATKIPDPGEKDLERSAKNSMNRTINKVYHLSRSNIWDWFITLTFDPEKVNSFDYGNCTKKLKNWLDIVKRSCPDLKYIIVPEKHKSGRFHFHGLFADCEGLEFTDSGHTTKGGIPIYNVGRYKLGFSTATKVTDNERVTKYISKYITKDLCAVSVGKKRYWASRNLAECPVEEMILESPSTLISQLLDTCKHCTVSGFEDGIQVHYFEMGADYGND